MNKTKTVGFKVSNEKHQLIRETAKKYSISVTSLVKIAVLTVVKEKPVLKLNLEYRDNG